VTIGAIAGGAAVAAGVAAKVATGGGSTETTSPAAPPVTGTIGAPGTPGFGPASAIRTSTAFRFGGIVAPRTLTAAQLRRFARPSARPNPAIDRGSTRGSFGMGQARGAMVRGPRLPVPGRPNLSLRGSIFPVRSSSMAMVALRAVRSGATHVSIAPPRTNSRIVPTRQVRSK
jgi:hypothetical protein